ncbi:MAG TPA: flagellar M-ring protein FliF C-terminal domain-containing protein [Pirellulales bacterium]|jgi:flagellar M-ring protein FliF|nr:flagellar M-ring protein FliF C-terminal domain-containing protein [Pirellulales bacterium]
MDFLNRALGQLTDLFKSMTPGARLTAGLLLAMIVVSMGFLVNRVGSDRDSYLMGGEVFSSPQLHNMEAAFAKANLSDYRIEGNRIQVSAGKQSAYMGALADAGALPPTFGKYLEKVVSTNSFWADKELRRQATKIATQNELQLILSNMRGIETAAVMYDVEESGPFGKSRTVTASVSVKTSTGMPLEEEQVRTIRHTVAPAIGAKAENISVTDLNGQVYPGSNGGSGAGGSEDPYGSRKRTYEKQWQEKIAATLGYIPGVLVTSNVELDPETEHSETHTEYDPKAVPYNTVETSKNNVMRGAGPSGRPGVAAQNGVNQPAAVSSSGGGAENTQEDNSIETQAAVPSTVRHSIQQGLTPKRVTVAISIPSSYYEKVWYEKNPPAAGAPPQKPDATALAEIESKVKGDVESAVVALLPAPAAGTDPFPRVRVTTFQHLPGPAIAKPALVNVISGWLAEYWQTLGMIGVALVGLGLLRSMVRAVPAAMAQPEQGEMFSARFSENTPAAEGQPLAPVGVQAARNRLKRRTPHGPSLREELSELVKEDPDTAVNVLRAWIGNSGNAN